MMDKGSQAQVDENLRWEAAPLSTAEIERLRPDWTAIAADAVTPNPFYEPFFVEATLGLTSKGADLGIFTVYQSNKLIAIWPFQTNRRSMNILPCFGTPLSHKYQYFPAPIIATGEAEAFARAFLHWIDQTPHRLCFALLENFPASGPIYSALQKAAAKQKRSFLELGRFERAYAIGHDDPEDYLNRTVSARRRKQLRAKRRKLAAHGPVTVETFAASDSFDVWFDDFVRLEDAGWKGAGGTSLKRNPADEISFRRLAKAAAQMNRLQFMRLCIGNQPIAYTIDITAGRGAFALKIAHDPEFNRYSPGVLLEVEVLSRFLSDPSVDWIDSSASSEHSVLNAIWRDKMPFSQAFISRRDLYSKIVTHAAAALYILNTRLQMIIASVRSTGLTGKKKHDGNENSLSRKSKEVLIRTANIRAKEC